jgi:sugar diacid utilization regulator
VGVADGASRDAGDVPAVFLGDYLPMLARAALVGRRADRAEIDAVRQQGRHAAEQGVPVGRGVDLYLSAARRVWAEPFGLDLTRAHQVALAEPGEVLPSIAAATTALERVVLDRFGDRDVLVATKEGLVVVLAVADAGGDLGRIVHGELRRLRQGQPWQVAVGRAHPGAYGIARSYEEAREGLTMARRMHLDRPVIETRDLLTYRVLSRDQPALVDLVHSVLDPLTGARGGAAPLVDTLAAYFESGCVATTTGTRLHLSVRAVTYRLERVRSLTGFDPLDPAHRFTLHAAVLGARLLGWPDQQLPTPGGPART